MEERADEGMAEIEQQLMDVADRARHSIEEFVDEQPHAALALAAAAGFVLGGGLTPRRLVRIGLAFAGPALTRALYGEATRALKGMIESAPVEEEAEQGAGMGH